MEPEPWIFDISVIFMEPYLKNFIPRAPMETPQKGDTPNLQRTPCIIEGGSILNILYFYSTI